MGESVMHSQIIVVSETGTEQAEALIRIPNCQHGQDWTPFAKILFFDGRHPDIKVTTKSGVIGAKATAQLLAILGVRTRLPAASYESVGIRDPESPNPGITTFGKWVPAEDLAQVVKMAFRNKA